MYIDSFFGPVLPEYGWVPAPRYCLRRERVLQLSADWKPGNLLEIGCGSGALLYEFGLLGHICVGLDESSNARELSRIINQGLLNVEITGKPNPSWKTTFDYVLAFEVLEHVENDFEALKQWRQWLRPNGCLLMSVPAHQRRWGATDVWAGHYRRYERRQLQEQVKSAGFVIERSECYGFPIANLVDPVRRMMHARIIKNTGGHNESVDRFILTQQSGVSRSLETKLFPLQKSWLGKLCFTAGFAVQKWTSASEMGTGYILLARRTAE